MSWQTFGRDPSDLFDEHVKMRDDVKAFLRPYWDQLATPPNLLLLTVFLAILAHRLLRPPTASIQLPPPPPAVVFRTFTPRVLLKYNGRPQPNDRTDTPTPVYMAAKGKVYDVSAGRNFYGPGGPYENFAGRDATRGLACQSFDEEMLTKDLDGPLDDCSDLTPDQIENLNGWVERFDDKYLVVGKLVPFNAAKSAWSF